MEITVCTEVTDEVMEAFERLIPQLSSSSPPPSREHLQRIIDCDDSVLFIARDETGILGSLTVAAYAVPTGVKSWIEDVVVDDAARGKGVGKALTEAGIEHARSIGAKSVDLTSRATREAANRLYLGTGFEVRDTNIYRYSFK